MPIAGYDDKLIQVNPLLNRQDVCLLMEKCTGISMPDSVPEVQPLLQIIEKYCEINQLLMKFKGDYSVEFRAFNDGIAYRFITNKKGMIEVNNETFQVNFPENYLLHVQHPGGFKTAYEEEYKHIESKDWKSSDKMALLPILHGQCFP